MRQFILLVLLSFSINLLSKAQSKIYFEDTEPELVLDIANGVLLTSDNILMKNENEDSIEVNWFFSLDIPTQENPNNENRLEEVWTVLLCDEVLCHSYPNAQSIIPPKDEYKWKFNVTSAFWLSYEWVLGEGKVTLTVTNIADQTETTSFTADLKIVSGGCMDEVACNYDPMATLDNGSCNFANDACFDEYGNDAVFDENCACVKPVCTDDNACNNGEDGTCIFLDCAGECGGSALAGSVCTDANGYESIYDDACTCIEVVGIDEFITLNKPIFPNPTNNIINLQLADVNHDIHSIKIINLQGQDVINLNGLDKKTAYQIDLSKLVKGLYHINLLDDKGKLLYSEMIERQ